MPDRNLLLGMWPAAAGIALMSFTESIAAARAFRREGDRHVVSNQELVAIGMGNVVGGFFGAMPSGGGTTQTAVNSVAGARSQVSGVILAVIALATMLFLAPLISKMPHATLAAVVIVYSVGLISPAEMKAISAGARHGVSLGAVGLFRRHTAGNPEGHHGRGAGVDAEPDVPVK